MANLLETVLKNALSGTELTELAGWPDALAEDYLEKEDSLRLIAEAVIEVANQTAAPATATSTGIKGQIAVDASFIYVCVATNTWRRVGITAW